MIARRIVAVVAVILCATQVVRNAVVAALAQSRPAAAQQFWSDHPATEISVAMTEIARSARGRRAIPASVFELMADAAAKEPLAPEPYLVRGVQAELAGDGLVAQRAFEQAQWRDPRSLPAAFFLADRYFRLGDSSRGLREIAALARLSPNGPETVAPYLAAYASNPANWGALKNVFRANPRLAEPALTALASKIETAPAVLALADPSQKLAERHWLEPLLSTLIEAGAVAQAHDIWLREAAIRTQPGALIYDRSFTDKAAPPPFNWALTSSTVGVAERQAGGRLHLIFYGREDGFLASQLLLLPAGSYVLSMQLLGDPVRARALSWSVWCEKGDAPLASATLDTVAARGLHIEVPAGCAAQWLRLGAVSSDLSQQADLTISGLRLEKAAAGA